MAKKRASTGLAITGENNQEIYEGFMLMALVTNILPLMETIEHDGAFR